ncbi:AAA family ATPase [Natrarchaeobius sp. A-rgal3]|uniref:AAA family ATPase n=1 Tax=Natrarchaeobius versutus TaxID=1679078 RepID=UPI003510BCF0
MPDHYDDATLDVEKERWYCTYFLVNQYNRVKDWEVTKDAHDHTAEITRDLMRALLEAQKFNDEELTALKSVIQLSGTIGIEKTIERIRDTEIESPKVETVIEGIRDSEGCGIVGGTAYPASVPDDETEVVLLESFETLLVDSATNEERDEAVRTVLDLDLQNVGLGTLSPIFSLLHPERYPIVNDQITSTLEVCLAIDIPEDSTRYFDAIEILEDVRSDFGFRDHYRHLDNFCYWANGDTDTTDWYEANDIPNRTVWQLNAGHQSDGGPDSLWPAWKEHGVCSISWDVGDLSELSMAELTDRSSEYDKERVENYLKRFHNELSAGEIIVAKDGGEMLGIGVLGADGYWYDQTYLDERIDGVSVSHPHYRSVEWIVVPSGDHPRTQQWNTGTGLSPRPTLDRTNAFEELRCALANREQNLGNDLIKLDRRSLAIRNGDDSPKKDWINEEPISRVADYYWVKQNHNPDEIEDEYLEAELDQYWAHDLRKLEPGDTIIHYREGELIGSSTVTTPAYRRVEDDTEFQRVDVDFDSFESPVSFASIFEQLLEEDYRFERHNPVNPQGVNQDYLFPLPDRAGRYLVEQGSTRVDDDRLEDLLSNPLFAPSIPQDLYYPPEQASQLTAQMRAAINSGKHIIFTGPPGTGKSELAEAICEHAVTNGAVDDWIFTTATSEWTAYDTVGGYMPIQDGSVDGLEFSPGQFLHCFRSREDDIVNRWLVIDELNRSDIDKAFGQLFSVLTGDSVELPYDGSGDEKEPIRVEWVDDGVDADKRSRIARNPNRYPMTPSWRLIGTMNTADKASLYEMSYAFMRRFAYIHVGIPRARTNEGYANQWLFDPKYESDQDPSNYATAWLAAADADKSGSLQETLEEVAAPLAVLWANLSEKRPVGPAILHDIVTYVDAYDIEGSSTGAALTDAIIALVLPQLEGMRPDERDVLLRGLDTSRERLLDPNGDEESIAAGQAPGLETERLYRTAEDMFGIDLTDEQDKS